MEQTRSIDGGLEVPALREVWDEGIVLEQIGSGRDTGKLLVRSAATAAAGAALFGAALGSYAQAPLQILSSAIKVPLLLVGTAALCFPTFFVVQALRSARALSLARAVSIQANALAVVGLVWGSFSLPTLFLVGTTGHYELAQWLSLAIGSAGGLAGFSRFLAAYSATTGSTARHALRSLVPYFALFAVVGGQLAWTLRPFIGSPSEGFEIFRRLDGNFLQHVLGLIAG